MALLHAETIRVIESTVIERIATVGRVMVIDQIALALRIKPADLAPLPDRCPGYARLLPLKPKYIALLAAEIRARPGKFSTLQECADYAELLSVQEEIKELSDQLKGPDNDGPKVA
jgi:hypothetical protein